VANAVYPACTSFAGMGRCCDAGSEKVLGVLVIGQQAKTIHSPEGAHIFVRWGGSGPVVVLIHGYAENSDSWAPLAADLMKDQR
jgi:hypothetical protein